MPAPDPLAAFRAADPPYQHALEELRALEFAREQGLLAAHTAGLSPAELAARTGLAITEVDRLLVRAERARAD